MAIFGRTPTESQWIKSMVARFMFQNSGRLAVVFVSVLILVFYLPSFLVTRELTLGLIIMALYVLIAFYLLKYASQTVSELRILISTARLDRAISKRIDTRRTPTKTQLQSRFEAVRGNIKEFVNTSIAVFPPISDYLFDKLKQSIDIFFYATGMVVLSEKPDYYSVSEKRQAEMEIEFWDEESELKAQAEEAAQAYEDEMTGYVRYFDIYELRSFLEFLANRIFAKGTFHPFWVIKYPINLIDLLNFFEHWNGVVLNSENGVQAAKSARSEVERFYSETRRREEIKAERIWTLMSSLIVAVLSALVGFMLGKLQ